MRAVMRWWSVLAVGLLTVTAAGCSAGGSSASCAAKEVTVRHTPLHPGGEVQLSVDWMTATCEDTGGTNRTARDIAVTITPRSTGKQYRLGTVDTASGPQFTVSGRFDLPENLPTGRAALSVVSPIGDHASASHPVKVTAH